MKSFDPTPLRPDAPAYPSRGGAYQGLTVRQQAAIALCVPDSGVEWLDTMIEQRLLNDFAAQAMARITAADVHGVVGPDITAAASFCLAKHMVAAGKKEQGNG